MGIDAVEWARKVEALGAGEILLTSMDGDGTKAGYDLELTCAIAESISIPVIASGGAGSWNTLKKRSLSAGQMQHLRRHCFTTKNWRSEKSKSTFFRKAYRFGYKLTIKIVAFQKNIQTICSKGVRPLLNKSSDNCKGVHICQD